MLVVLIGKHTAVGSRVCDNQILAQIRLILTAIDKLTAIPWQIGDCNLFRHLGSGPYSQSQHLLQAELHGVLPVRDGSFEPIQQNATQWSNRLRCSMAAMGWLTSTRLWLGWMWSKPCSKRWKPNSE